MANRNRTNPVQFYLSDDEQYILNTKFKASGMKSMSAFLRKLVLLDMCMMSITVICEIIIQSLDESVPV